MTRVTSRLTAKNRDQLQNPTLGTFTFARRSRTYVLLAYIKCNGESFIFALQMCSYLLIFIPLWVSNLCNMQQTRGAECKTTQQETVTCKNQSHQIQQHPTLCTHYNKSVFSLLHQLTMWHCSHSLLITMLPWSKRQPCQTQMHRAATDQYCPPAGLTAANPLHAAIDWRDRQTDIQRDAGQFHRCSCALLCEQWYDDTATEHVTTHHTKLETWSPIYKISYDLS